LQGNLKMYHLPAFCAKIVEVFAEGVHEEQKLSA
jgi:hypothetical protein